MATKKQNFKPEDKRLLNRWYGTLYKADVFKSIEHTRQEENRVTENNFFKRFGKWLRD